MLSTEVDYSRRLIEKAERRLRHQKAVVDAIDASQPELISLGRELALLMEDRLALLHDNHRRLLEEAMLDPFVPALRLEDD